MKYRLPSLAGAPLLWSAHFVAVYGLASLVCAAPQALPVSPTMATAVMVVVLTAAALAAAVLGLLRNRRRLRRSGTGEPEFFLAQANLLLYGLSMVAMLWVALPGLLLPSCV